MADLPRTASLIKAGLARGLHPGAQLYASVHGEPVINAAWGEASPPAAMTPDSLCLWLSASKPVASVAVAQLWESGKLHIDDPVARFVPGFDRHGKGGVTIRHLLTHTTGMKHVPLPDDWSGILDALRDAELEPDARPGSRARYSAHANWYLLGEVIQSASREPFARYTRAHIFEPLDMPDCWISLPPERFDAYGPRMAATHYTGDREPGVLPLSTRESLARPIPGANCVGPAHQLAHLYEALLGGGERRGVRVLEPETVELFTGVHREKLFDHSFQYPMVWGLGFIRQNPKRRGRMPYGYGRHASPETFGHGGMESTVAFADPAHALAAALVFTGMPGEREHQRRIDAVLTSLYDELGLV